MFALFVFSLETLGIIMEMLILRIIISFFFKIRNNDNLLGFFDNYLGHMFNNLKDNMPVNKATVTQLEPKTEHGKIKDGIAKG